MNITSSHKACCYRKDTTTTTNIKNRLNTILAICLQISIIIKILLYLTKTKSCSLMSTSTKSRNCFNSDNLVIRISLKNIFVSHIALLYHFLIPGWHYNKILIKSRWLKELFKLIIPCRIISRFSNLNLLRSYRKKLLKSVKLSLNFIDEFAKLLIIKSVIKIT